MDKQRGLDPRPPQANPSIKLKDDPNGTSQTKRAHIRHRIRPELSPLTSHQTSSGPALQPQPQLNLRAAPKRIYNEKPHIPHKRAGKSGKIKSLRRGCHPRTWGTTQTDAVQKCEKRKKGRRGLQPQRRPGRHQGSELRGPPAKE